MAGNKLRWFSGSGGPLILLPEELLEHWSGIDPPPDGRVVETKERWDPEAPATDYDSACEVEDLIANVDVGKGRGIVFGGDGLPTALLGDPADGMLVRWDEGDSEEEVLAAARAAGADFDEGTVAWIEAQPGPLILFDAACPGPEVEEDRLVLKLHPGQYVANAVRHAPEDAASVVLVQLNKVG